MAAPTANVAAYLAQQKKATDKELATEWNALEDLYNEKYFYIKIIIKRFWLHLYALHYLQIVERVDNTFDTFYP